MKTKIIKLKETDSTNCWLKDYTPGDGEEMTVVIADYQTAGHGQAGSHWESEAGENLLFSILVHPVWVPVGQQFLLSMAGALALKMVLSTYTEDISLKWPNDVYWKDKKISGTLIETTLAQGHIKNCIFGIGLDVNQLDFHSDAPNPISLRQILGHKVDKEVLMNQIIKCFEQCFTLLQNGDYTDVVTLYHDSLYWKHGFHSFRDAEGNFEAAIVEVEDNGHLILRDREGVIREYAFKELKFLLGQE